MTNDQIKLDRVNLVIDGLVKTTISKKLTSLTVNVVFSNILIYLVLMTLNPLIDNYIIIILIVLFSFIYFYFSINSHSFKAITKKNILEHINRNLPEYQESSQIILDRSNSPIKNGLRKYIIGQILSDEKQGVLKSVMPNVSWKTPVILLLIIILTNIFSENLEIFFAKKWLKDEIVQELQLKPSESGLEPPISIDNATISVSPPQYTELENRHYENLNLTIPENSLVNWDISIHGKVDDVFIVLVATGSLRNKFKMLYKAETNSYVFNRKIQHTQIYNFEVTEDGISRLIEGVHSIVLIKDQSPKIKIINPKQSLVEFPTSGNHSFLLSADVSDDYGISNVLILASVAKGSGEAVKFRDKTFKFDEVNKNISQASKKADYRYKKKWRLKELDMEPGDEVYFNIIAKDNRQPETQTSKSASVIVRWLDDEEMELSAEGIRIGFVPEYFRSQRQIIIETIELIEDKNDLSTVEFSDRSVDLGHSQNDLKTKYGRYLGDEFGEGPEEHFGLSDGYHGDGEVDNAGIVDNHSDESEHNDEHDESGETEKFGDGEALIEKFTHNHGTEEIAPLSSRDPKTWMKMAVSEMWQAELHLMLSEPAKALHFENKAYKYLKEARKADRIYAKRLGFEPPPVTEDRRLTGELSDLGSNFINSKGFTNHKSIEKNIRATYALINHWILLNDKQQESFEIDFERLKIISSLKNDLLELTKSRPVLIKYVAILAQIGLSKKLLLKGCNNCINDLQQRLWSLLTIPNSLPNTKNDTSGLSNQSKKQYLNTVRKLIHSTSVNYEGRNDER